MTVDDRRRSIAIAFQRNSTPIDKVKFTDFYQRYFAELTPKILLEIGVLEGGSLRAWKEIFPDTCVFGIDIDPTVKARYPELDIFIGDQKDTAFLDAVLRETGVPDIVIDDGGHCRSQQIESFRHLYPQLNAGGLYIIEDIETSFLEEYNDQEVSVIEYIKSLVTPIDYLSCSRLNDYLVKLAEPPGRVFHYVASSITFEPNVCLVRK